MTALRNQLASQSTDPGGPGMFTMMGENRFGDGSTSRNPFPFQWLKYISVRNASSAGDFLTVMHPRKVGVTPEITTELVSSSATAVTLRVNYNGRIDTIALTSTGATITKGGEPLVQFTKSWPQSGVSGPAGYVKADFHTAPVTTLTNAITTTGPVEVHTGELALGSANRIPNSATLMVKPGAAFNTATYNETVGTLLMNGGVLKGSGTLTASSIEWWGGIVTAPVSSSGNFVKKGGVDWSRPANITYSGDTVIESGNLAFQPGGPALPGTGRVVLADGTGLNLNGAAASITQLDVTGNATLTDGTLSVTQSLTGTGTLTNTGSLDLSGVSTISPTVSLATTGTLTLPAGSWSVKRLIINGVIQRAGTPVDAASHPGLVSGAGSITALEDIPAPTGLSATATLGQVNLTWDSNPGVPGYVVRRATTPGGPYSDIGTPASANFADTLVTDGITYYYVVAARDAYGDSANSNEVSVTAIGPWYFDPNGTTAGSVANGGSYDWVTNSWTQTPGGTAATVASAALRHVQFAATSPGLPLSYSVTVGSNYSGLAHGFLSMRVTQGMVTFTGTPGNFYWTQPPVITADAGATIRFAQAGSLAFNLNNQNVTFDGAGTTLVSPDTVIKNGGSITKAGAGTLVLAAPNIYTGATVINGGTLRLATTDLPTLWLDATKSSSLALADGAISQWNDASGRGTFVSQATAANRPLPVTDNTLAGPAKSLVDFGAYVYGGTNAPWMQMGASMTDIRALFWVGKTTNENFLLGSTATDYHFHSNGAGASIWHSIHAHDNVLDGATWLNGGAVDGAATVMPSGLVRLGVFTTGNVNANTLGRDRTFRTGGIQPGEVMVFNTTLTSQQQAEIDAYLAKKWSNTGTGIGDRLPASTVVSMSNGAELDLTGINFQTIAGLEANDNTGTRVELGAADLTVSAAGSSSFDGVISGSGSLRMNGSGQFTLAGSNTYTGPTIVEAGTLVVENSITSCVTVKTGALLVNNGTITGDVIIENGGTYLGEGNITGTITTSPPVVTITSPSVDNIVLPDLATDLNLTASIVFNAAFGTPSITWSMVNGPGSVTFENPSLPTTTARFSATGSYTLRCTATVTVNDQLMQGSAELVVQPGGPAINNFTATFRQGENGYAHAATFIRGDSATWNSGARDQFLIGRNNSGAMRGLFAFDLSSVPTEATVTSAAFDLWIPQVGIGTVNAFELRPLLKDFIEGTGNSSNSASVGANTGADWNSRTGPTTANLWGTLGGQSGTDFSATVIGSLAGFDATAAATVGSKLGFTLNPAFVTEATAALSAARPLRFMLTMATDTTGSNRFVRFASDDHATTSQRPQLTIHYTTGNPVVPTVDPGFAPAAVQDQPAALTGNVSNASEGTLWTLVSGPGDAIFTDATAASTTVTFSAAGNYVLRLTATTSAGSSSRTLAVSVSPADPFASWQELHWPGVSDPTVIGQAADPNSDGETNLLEFATGQNPNAATRATILVEPAPSGIEFTYVRNRVALDDGWVFSVEHNDDLGASWVPVGAGSVVSDGPMQTVMAFVPTNGSARCFARLRVTAPD
jgi:autotransporter-associated beta strand protein